MLRELTRMNLRIAAWNAHDLDGVLSFYTEDFELSSPYIVDIMGEPSGTLCGKPSIRAYWERAIALYPDLHFTLDRPYTGTNSVVICYTNQAGGRRGELLILDPRANASAQPHTALNRLVGSLATGKSRVTTYHTLSDRHQQAKRISPPRLLRHCCSATS